MAEFLPAYNLERKHEGYYVNHPNDKGGETYAGVARNIHPTWQGWLPIDRYKATLGRALRTNEEIPGLELYVQAFYKNLWDSKNFAAIKNQDVANIVYDFYINSGNTGIKKTQEVLRDVFNANIAVDGQIGPQTIAAINAQDPAKLNDAIKEKRIAFYHSLVSNNPTQAVFLTGWLARINSFPWLSPTAMGIGGLLVLTGIFFLVYHLTKSNKKKSNA